MLFGLSLTRFSVTSGAFRECRFQSRVHGLPVGPAPESGPEAREQPPQIFGIVALINHERLILLPSLSSISRIPPQKQFSQVVPAPGSLLHGPLICNQKRVGSGSLSKRRCAPMLRPRLTGNCPFARRIFPGRPRDDSDPNMHRKGGISCPSLGMPHYPSPLVVEKCPAPWCRDLVAGLAALGGRRILVCCGLGNCLISS